MKRRYLFCSPEVFVLCEHSRQLVSGAKAARYFSCFFVYLPNFIAGFFSFVVLVGKSAPVVLSR